jgi:hypothetical protein
MGFELTIPVFERAKMVDALGRTVTLICFGEAFRLHFQDKIL